MTDFYKLVGKEVQPCTLLEWGKMFNGNRHVALEVVGGIRVSTVFLGLDHGYGGGDPILFETMAFVGGSSLDICMDRYCTYEQAEAGHKAVVAHIKSHRWSMIVLPWLQLFYRRARNRFYDLGNKVWAGYRRFIDWIIH